MADEVMKIETRGRVRLLILDRPDVRNALNTEMVEGVMDAVIEADRDPQVYVIAITGAGSAFCSGADLRSARDTADAGKPFYGPLHSSRRSICETLIDAQAHAGHRQ